MKQLIIIKFKIIFVFVASLVLMRCVNQDIIPDANLYVSKYNAVFFTPSKHVPTNKVPDGPIAGNGDVGFVLGGTRDTLNYYFSKNDFWESRPGYPEGGIRLVGGLKIVALDLKSNSYWAEQKLDDATINLRLKNEVSTFTGSSWVASAENIIIITLRSKGMPVNVSLDLWGHTGNESTNRAGKKGDIYWFTRSFDSPELEWPSHIAVAMKIIGASGKTFTLSDKPVQLVVSFSTNHDTDDYFSHAIELVSNIEKSDIEELRKKHENWWVNFWKKSSVEIGDSLLEKYYYGSQYLLASSSRNVDFPPGLWGNSITLDGSANNWAGDYHLNYNFQASWWGAYSSNHVDITEPYDTPILEYADNAKRHAHELLNKKGVYYPVGIGPKGFCSSRYPVTPEKMELLYGTRDNKIDGGIMFLGQKSNNLFCTTNMFMRFYSTYDENYAKKVYPFIREVADFWEDYLVFEDGRYVSYDDNFWEVGPWQGKNWKEGYGDINPTITLGLLKMFLNGVLNMSKFLNVDEEKYEKWNHMLEHLSEIPTVKVGKNIRVKACEGGAGSGSRTLPGFGRVMMHGLVFPSDAYGPIRDSAFASILRNEISLWGKEPMSDFNWNNLGNGFEVYFTGAARVGYDPNTILSKLKERIDRSARPNLWVAQDGGGIETFSAIPSCINEMLLQGYEGIVRVFPSWPMDKDAKFKTLRSYGAFLISSELKNGIVQFVEIRSEQGRTFSFENPWDGKAVLVKSNLGYEKVFDGNRFLFETKKEEKFYLTPQ